MNRREQRAQARAEAMRVLRTPIKEPVTPGQLIAGVAASVLVGIGVAVYFTANARPIHGMLWTAPLLDLAWAAPWFIASCAVLRFSARHLGPRWPMPEWLEGDLQGR